MRKISITASSQRGVPNTFKKLVNLPESASSSGISVSLGRYRPIGPKIHEFGRHPSPMKENTPLETVEMNLYQHYENQLQIQANQEIVSDQHRQLQSKQFKEQQPSQLQQQQQQNQLQQLKSLSSTLLPSSALINSVGQQASQVVSNPNCFNSTQNSSSANAIILDEEASSSRKLAKLRENIQSSIDDGAIENLTSVESDGQSQSDIAITSPRVTGIQLESELTSLKTQLQTIFHFYASFGDRQNITNLKSNKFSKMFVDAGVIGPILSTTRVDLLFCQSNKHQSNMTFDRFLDTLPKMALLIFDRLSPQEAMLALITNHLSSLYENIMEKTDLGFELSSFTLPLEVDCIEILQPLYPILQKIYQTYFTWELSANGLVSKTRSLKALLMFLCEFEICPTRFSKSTAFLLFNYLIELKNINSQFSVGDDSPKDHSVFGFSDFGQKLTFQKFLVYLIRSAVICYENRIDRDKYTCSSHLEMLNLLLERMEVSPGFLNIQKKTHSTNNSHTSLLIPSTLVTQLSMSKSIDWSTPRASQVCSFLAGKMNNSGSQSPSSLAGSLFGGAGGHTASRISSRSASNTRKSFLAERLCAQTFESQDILQKHRETIAKIFQSYCSYGEPMNKTTLKTIKLIKLLTDAGILKKSFSSPTSQAFRRVNCRRHINGVSQDSSVHGNGTTLTSRSRASLSSGIAAARDSESNQSRQVEGTAPLNNLLDEPSDQNSLSHVTGASTILHLSIIDMDFMVTKLTGHRWIKSFNLAAKGFNDRVTSPKLGFSSHLFRNDESLGAKGKIELDHFLKLLEMIADKLYPSLQPQQALQIIVEECILNIRNEKNNQQSRKTMQDYLVILVDTLKDEQIVNLLGDVHQSLAMYYKVYQDRKGYMNIRQFMKFFKDFDIFPLMASKSKISTIFYTLANVLTDQLERTPDTGMMIVNQSFSSNNSGKSRAKDENLSITSHRDRANQPEQEVIDQHLFVEAIALLATEIYIDQPTNMFKIIMLLERMNNSNGPITIQKKLGHTRSTDGYHWDMLHTIRKKYPEFYQQTSADSSRRRSTYSTNISSQQQIGGFDSVMRQGLSGSSIAFNQSRNQNQEAHEQRHAYYAQRNQQEYEEDIPSEIENSYKQGYNSATPLASDSHSTAKKSRNSQQDHKHDSPDFKRRN